MVTKNALHTYEETLSFEEVTPRTKCYMGECLERLGNLEQASEYYRASLKLDPAFADAFIGLGVLADLQGRLGEACSHFEQALSIEPEHADYHLLLAGSLKKKGEHTMHSIGVYAKDDNAKGELIDGGGGVWYEHDVSDDEKEDD